MYTFITKTVRQWFHEEWKTLKMETGSNETQTIQQWQTAYSLRVAEYVCNASNDVCAV